MDEVPISSRILPKFNNFVNSDDCIGKITSKYIRLQPVFIQKTKIEVNKKQTFSNEKMRNPGNCIYDYAHSFFVEDF